MTKKLNRIVNLPVLVQGVFYVALALGIITGIIFVSTFPKEGAEVSELLTTVHSTAYSNFGFIGFIVIGTDYLKVRENNEQYFNRNFHYSADMTYFTICLTLLLISFIVSTVELVSMYIKL